MELLENMRAEVNNRVSEMKGLSVVGEDYSKAVTSASKMANVLNDLEKTENERLKNERAYELEKEKTSNTLALENEKLKKEVRDRKIKNIIAIGTSLLSLGAALFTVNESWKREDEGPMTYSAGKKANDFLMKFGLK